MFGDSRALFTDSNAIFSSNSDPDMLTKSRMNFDMNNNSNIQDYKQYQNTQTNSGLLRFRSAPSSLFANFDDGDVVKSGDSNEDFMAESFKGLDDNKSLPNGFAVNSRLPPHYYPRHTSSLGIGTQVGAVDNSSTYRMRSSMGMENQAKMVSSLMRQNSSPAGLFSHLNSQTGYAAIRGGVGNYRLGDGSNGDLSPTASRFKSQMSFLSGSPSSLGMLSRISEIEGENIGATGNDDAKSGSGNGDTQFYSSEFPPSSWSDSLHFAENFTGLKRELHDDEKLFSGAQNTNLANRPPLLSHHLSLPKISSDMAAMDKLMQFRDSVPFKIRAKRGCATHPRSIAERVRRTRISERMRKLQELVPHMDKQTNTADMLDLAVDYIKDLQKQFKTLSDNRANCKCSSMQKPVLN